MTKIIRLTESDLTRIVKRVIKESEENTIHIPRKYDGVRMELGKRAKPQDIIEMYNELVEEGTPLVDYSEYGTEGMFYNEDDEEIPTDVILDELNYAIVGDEDDEESLYESDLARIVKQVISESKKDLSKSEILKMSKDELKDVYGELEVKGEYQGKKGTFHHFKRTAIGDIVCSFRTDDATPSGLKRNTQGIKVKNLDF